MASGSAALDEIVAKLKGSSDPKRRYEYVLWLAKKLPPAPAVFQCESNRVKGCVSQVFVQPQLDEGLLQCQGDADAQITKGLLALLITGLNGLSAAEVVAVHPSFMAETGLQASLTPSRANGFLNILRHMQAQAAALAATA